MVVQRTEEKCLENLFCKAAVLAQSILKIVFRSSEVKPSCFQQSSREIFPVFALPL